MKRYLLLLFLLSLTENVVFAQGGKTTGKAYVGYAKYDDQIWEWDGLSLEFNATVGCAIVLTRQQLEPYIGGTIKGMRVGWDTSSQTGSYQGFVRTTFNGEDLTTGKATVRLGWNNMTLSDYQIPEDVEQLVVGFTTKLKKDVCAIPTFYPHDVANSCYLWVDGDNDEEGNPIWRDMKDRGILPILLTIQDTGGTFNYVPVVTTMTTDGIVTPETPSEVLIRVKNAGSQTIKGLTVTSRQEGGEPYSRDINLTKSITAGTTSGSFLIPVYCYHSGKVELSITKVNGTEIEPSKVGDLLLIAIPDEVAGQYTRRPLVEYYESENSYMSPRYYDEIVEPSIHNKLDRMTFVCQHLDDQFMTGDDDATVLALQLCDNDSASVSIPAMTIDRAMSTDNISFQQNTTTNPMFPVLYEPYATQALNAALEHPTFVSLEAKGFFGLGGEVADININGHIAPGILPTGEQLRLTVYLMEHDVDSDSQLFWTEEEKIGKEGHYVHTNVIREILTDRDGDPIEGEGDFHKNFVTDPDPSWNPENLYVVAFIHRDGSLGGKYMHVFNSAEGGFTWTGDGIEGIQNSPSIHHGAGTVYDLSGREVHRTSEPRTLPNGIYITNGKKVVVR